MCNMIASKQEREREIVCVCVCDREEVRLIFLNLIIGISGEEEEALVGFVRFIFILNV